MSTVSVEERLQNLETQVEAINLLVFAALSCLKPEEIFAVLSTIKEALNEAEDPRANGVLAHIEQVEELLRKQVAGVRQILLG